MVRRPFSTFVLAAVIVATTVATWPWGSDQPAAAQSGVTLYVDAGGRGGACSDGRDLAAAQSPATPVCTIARGLAVAPSGARIVVRAGNYAALTVSGGSRTGLVTVAAQAGERVALPRILINNNASFLRFEGLALTGSSDGPSFRVQEGSSHDIQLVGSDVRSANQDAIDLRWGINRILVEGNHVNSRAPGASGGGNGISLTSTTRRPGVPDPGATVYPPVSNVTIRNNHFDGIGTDAIRPANFDHLVIEGNEINGVVENGEHNDVIQVVWGGDHMIFRNNYIHDNEGQGLFIKDGQVTDVDVSNNIIVRNTGNGPSVQLFDVIGVRLVNNTVWDNQANVVLRDGLRNLVIRNNALQRLDAEAPDLAQIKATSKQDHNLIGGSYRWEIHGPGDVYANAKFVNPARHDYRLAAGSPGVDAGSGELAPGADKACRARYDVPGVANTGTGSPPFVDMGALEQSPSSQAGDTAAAWRADCSAPLPGAPATGAPGCNCTGAKGGAAVLKLRRARVRDGRLVLTLRISGICRVRGSGRVSWRKSGSPRSRTLKAKTSKSGASATSLKLRLKLPRAARLAYRAHKRLTVRLRFRVTDCAGHARVVKRLVHLRRR